ncbi:MULTISPECIES: hypothetical protein [Butyricimonas]|uniref:hypothetical protein n=1 Tax=Butyricimonas TaxID=574697 RepID=UPI001D0818A2|nr:MULTISPECIES: hypothetical protein [Butyricimonas]MCB6971342.1 hypothetical protein [Butyricimonas synergistica]MCG4518056.1 hypothetical protein [Butyricimonas sp. DFI.6.44]
MKVRDFINGIIVGRRGNVIYYERAGRLYMRRYAIPGKKRKWETEGRSPGQKAAVARFKAVQMFYAEYAKQVSPEVWRCVAKARGKMAPNLFNSMNFNCFDGEGKMVDFEGFRFTEGVLALPREIRIVREGKRFRVTWREERDWSTAARGDVMQVGVLYDNLVRSPRLALEVTGRRGDLRGEFVLNESIGGSAHVYIFFASAGNTAFSPSWYLRVE